MSTVTKPKLVLAIVALALAVPATAVATHTFADVADGRFYTDDAVTRGQNVTFAKRYDDNIVQPGLSSLGTDIGSNVAEIDANAADIATNAADVAANALAIEATQVTTIGAPRSPR